MSACINICEMQGLEVKVWRRYEDFIDELSKKFPHEKAGLKKFYDECWRVFNALNSLDLKSLEEPRYLLGGNPLCSQSLRLFACLHLGNVMLKMSGIAVCCLEARPPNGLMTLKKYKILMTIASHGFAHLLLWIDEPHIASK